MTKERNVNLDHDDFITSVGSRLGDEPDFIRSDLEWIEGVQGTAKNNLLTEDEFPTPIYFTSAPELHPDRPLGSNMMLDAHGAKNRLKGCRPGAWIISPFAGRKWAVWPSGYVGWVPMDIEFPDCLKVFSRDDLN